MSFDFGQLFVTLDAQRMVNPARAVALFKRHIAGDSGSVDAEGRAANGRAVRNGGRIVSAYPIDPAQPCGGDGANTVWIITVADRSVTTILLPEEHSQFFTVDVEAGR